MPTLAEILQQTGFTKEQIEALDPKLSTALTGYMSSAEQKEKEAVAAAAKAEADRKAAEESARQAEALKAAAKAAQDAAELEKRSNVEFYETKVMPGLLGFEEEKKQIELARINAASEATFYKNQVEELKKAGLLPSSSPNFVMPTNTPGNDNNNQNRDGQGRFVAGNSGSPTFVNPAEIAGKIGDVAGTITDIQWKYSTLFGKPLPIAPSQLIAQADAQKLSPMDYAARTFGFAQKEQEMAQAAAAAHDEQVKAAAIAARDAEHKAEIEKMRAEAEAERKKLAERMMGNNPDVKVATTAKIAEVARAVKAGERKDPLKMTDAERRAATRNAIHQEIAARETAVA